jgi:ABC-type Fe3+-hydroxamate transport system substrate-binding protein
VNIEILNFDEIATATRRVAEVIGGDAARARAEELVERLEEAASRREGVRERAGRIVSLYGVDPLGVAGPGSFTHELVERIGADAVPDRGAAFISMDPEDLRRLAPDTVVVWAPGIGAKEKAAIIARLARLDLQSASQQRVIFIEDEGALLPSTAMIGAAQEVAQKLLGLPTP